MSEHVIVPNLDHIVMNHDLVRHEERHNNGTFRPMISMLLIYHLMTNGEHTIKGTAWTWKSRRFDSQSSVEENNMTRPDIGSSQSSIFRVADR